MDRKPDRRVNRTRRALKDALLALVLNNGYDSVTVEEITERADLGRTTFYLHYKDKEELLLESIGELIDDLMRQITQVPNDTWMLVGTARDSLADDLPDNPASNPILLTFQHAADNAALYRVILRGEGTFSANRRIREIIIQAVYDLLELKSQNKNLALKPKVPLQVFASYVAMAWIGMITWWLEEDMPYPPVQIAWMFQQMFMRGALDVLGALTPDCP